LELYEPLVEEKGQTLTVTLGPSIEFEADRDMLFQAFANLIDNAIKYTPPGGEITISSGTYRQDVKSKKSTKDANENMGKYWFVEINDDGPGIPKEEHEKVVQRFYRIDPSRTTPGSGLGLALVFAVLKLHKLDLEFSDNQPGLNVKVSSSIN